MKLLFNTSLVVMFTCSLFVMPMESDDRKTRKETEQREDAQREWEFNMRTERAIDGYNREERKSRG